jgi:hypothetical protein
MFQFLQPIVQFFSPKIGFCYPILFNIFVIAIELQSFYLKDRLNFNQKIDANWDVLASNESQPLKVILFMEKAVHPECSC